MAEDSRKQAFWTSLPGILTGAAAIIAAIGGILITMMKDDNAAPDAASQTQSARIPSSAPATSVKPDAPATPDIATQVVPPPTDWPLVAEETYTEATAGWYQGRHSDEGFRRLEASITGGKYRWDIEFKKAWERVIESPQGPSVNFYAAVDTRFVSYRPEYEFAAIILFGRANDQDYTFRLSSRQYFSLSRFDGTANATIISWTPIKFKPDANNRMAVVVENKQIKLFINGKLVGSYIDPNYSGGKVGVGVAGYDANTAVVVDFDNFEYRQKP